MQCTNMSKMIKFIKSLTPLEWFAIFVALVSLILNVSFYYWVVTSLLSLL